MERKEIFRLVQRYNRGQCDPDEIVWLESWYVRQQELHQLELTEQELAGDLADVEQRLYQERIQRNRSWGLRLRQPTHGLRRWAARVAAIAVLVGIGWILAGRLATEDAIRAAEVHPGGNRATLTLADGTLVALDENQQGIVFGDHDIRYSDGSVLSNLIRNEAEDQPEPTAMLHLTTPQGGTYQIALSDGSKIWLNAGSTLTYPSSFRDTARVVSLRGEAYFDIAKDRQRPFRVMSGVQMVEVLGTEFNVTAYADEPLIQTTLVKGSVLVRHQGQPNGAAYDVVLKPGTQALVETDNTVGVSRSISVKEVDVMRYTSWKDGYFALQGTIPSILRRVSRWYDIVVVYQGDETDALQVTASVSRQMPLADILSALQEMDPSLRYKLEIINQKERRLTLFR